MVRISEVIGPSDSVCAGVEAYQQLLNLAKNVQADVSFLGWRYITSTQYEGYASLESLAEKVNFLNEKHLNISNPERAIGKQIGEQIIKLYDDSSKKLENKWLFTRILCYLRDVNFDILGGSESIPAKFYKTYFIKKTVQ